MWTCRRRISRSTLCVRAKRYWRKAERSKRYELRFSGALARVSLQLKKTILCNSINNLTRVIYFIGKSSLINSLLKFEKIAPKVRYNRQDPRTGEITYFFLDVERGSC